MLSISKRQRLVLSALGVANLILLVTTVMLLGPSTPDADVVDVLEEVKLPPTLPANHAQCRTQAALALTNHDVAGIVALPLDGSIQFVLSGDDPADAWKALTISTELADQDCGPYNPIWVDVPDPSHIPHQRLVVEAHWGDVRSWSLGEMDDEELSNKFQRSAYSLSQSTP